MPAGCPERAVGEKSRLRGDLPGSHLGSSLRRAFRWDAGPSSASSVLELRSSGKASAAGAHLRPWGRGVSSAALPSAVFRRVNRHRSVGWDEDLRPGAEGRAEEEAFWRETWKQATNLPEGPGCMFVLSPGHQTGKEH